jgi:acetyl-CoA carboxylase carboxyl transferase subunit alpha
MATAAQQLHSAQDDYLPFEQELQQLDGQIRKLEELSRTNAMDLAEEIAELKRRRQEAFKGIYAKLTPWDRILLARHPRRPQTLDYVKLLCEDFLELHGDRSFADDAAVVTGLATLAGHRLMLIGQHKGRDVQERVKCNFGYMQPEGYHKALWKMRLAEQFRLPLVTLIDTKGAAAAVEAEERGQAQAIAYNLMVMSGLKIPIVSVIIGEGCSGGALGIGVGDRLLVQEYAYFTVIAPEGCASILWKDPNKKEQAAAALKMAAPDLLALGVVDGIVPEPAGGAHRDPSAAAELLKEALAEQLAALEKIPVPELLEKRYQRLRKLGKYRHAPAVPARSSAALS